MATNDANVMNLMCTSILLLSRKVVSYDNVIDQSILTFNNDWF